MNNLDKACSIENATLTASADIADKKTINNERLNIHQAIWNKPELGEVKFAACTINYQG